MLLIALLYPAKASSRLQNRINGRWSSSSNARSCTARRQDRMASHFLFSTVDNAITFRACDHRHTCTHVMDEDGQRQQGCEDQEEYAPQPERMHTCGAAQVASQKAQVASNFQPRRATAGWSRPQWPGALTHIHRMQTTQISRHRSQWQPWISAGLPSAAARQVAKT